MDQDEQDVRKRQQQQQPASNNEEKIQSSVLPGPFSANRITAEMSTKEAYFDQLRAWVNQANMSQNALACFPYYLMSNYPQLFQSQGGTAAATTTNASQMNGGLPGAAAAGQNIPNDLQGQRRLADYFDNLRQEEIINQNGGYEFVIAPLWKRFVAELIDVLILLLLKIMVTFTIVDMLDINVSNNLNLDKLKKAIESNYVEFIFMTSDFLIMEVITRIGVCFYEALWTMTGHVYVGGATPGKILMGIRVVYVEAVVPLEPPQPGMNVNNNGRPLRALLHPATNLGFRRAFFRSVAKNVLMALFFPMCFIMLFFKNNRTGYDIMTKTIVVEENHAPTLRRR